MPKQYSAKVTHVGEKNGMIDSILLNVGHAKTLTVKYNDKHFGGELVEKNSVVTFTADSIDEVQFQDNKTGDIKDGNYLEASNFKMLSARMPEITILRKAATFGDSEQHPVDAPHPASDPANFDQA